MRVGIYVYLFGGKLLLTFFLFLEERFFHLWFNLSQTQTLVQCSVCRRRCCEL